MKRLVGWFDVEDWKKAVALVILYAYAYQLCAWPVLFWGTTLLTIFTDMQWPGPPLLPWEHLIAGTTTLATIGGIQAFRERQAPAADGTGTTGTTGAGDGR